MASNPSSSGGTQNPFSDPAPAPGQRHERRNTAPLPYPDDGQLMGSAAHSTGGGDEINTAPLFSNSRYSTAPEAEQLVRRHANTMPYVPSRPVQTLNKQDDDGSDTEVSSEDEDDLDEYFKRRQPANGVLSSLLMLYGPGDGIGDNRGGFQSQPRTRSTSLASERTVIEERKDKPTTKTTEVSSESEDDWESFSSKPRWYSQASQSKLSLVESTHKVPEITGDVASVLSTSEAPRKPGKRERLKAYARNFRGKKGHEELKITVHIAETLQRQKYILKLCRALMLFGAPSHRIEDFLQVTATVLAVTCSFIYLPGVMVVSFQDLQTHTSDVQVVKCSTTLDLGKLQYVHVIYKEVLHDVISVETGTEKLEKLIRKPPLRNVWFKVLLYGGASAAIAPLFDARVKDLPFCFLLGLVVALMGLVINPKNEAFANVFEIMGTIIVSFFARAFGSIRMHGDELFCFSGITQGAIAPLLLPGYVILLGALELQSKKLIAGAVRMFYAVIYSVLLWFGISIGTALYGFVDKRATNETVCNNQNLKEFRFFYVPLFTFFVLLANQARWKQAPAMLVISLVGYTVNYFSADRFPYTPQIANGLAALTVGVLGNLYSRIVHQAAFTAMVPAILLQVQSGIASQGSLMSGLTVAMTIVEGDRAPNPDKGAGGFVVDGGAGNLALGLVAISVSISFGLFLSSVLVYPLGKGKKQSAIFAF